MKIRKKGFSEKKKIVAPSFSGVTEKTWSFTLSQRVQEIWFAMIQSRARQRWQTYLRMYKNK